MGNSMSDSYKTYIRTLDEDLKKLYNISTIARSKGLDPSLKPECIIAKDIADLVEGLGQNGNAQSQAFGLCFELFLSRIVDSFGALGGRAVAQLL